VVELIATCWTTAGDVRPDSPDNLGRWPLPQRIEAAARAGYAGSGFWLGDLLTWRRQGNSYSALARHIAAAGQRLVELEFLSDWFATGPRRAQSDAARAELFRAASELGARHLKVMPPFLGDDPHGGELAERFAELCAEAAPYGLRIGLEMLPFSRLPTLSAALEMVRAADAGNGGLLIDIWHVCRSGSGVSQVAEIPRRFIVAVELCDARNAVQGSLLEDTMCRRRLCGEGEFDLASFIAALGRAGYDGPYGVEILSDAFRKLPLVDAARRSAETAAAQFPST